MDEWSNICSSFLFVDNTSVYQYNISKERSKIVMIIDELLKNEKISHYKLSKLSGVPQATISDLCSGKSDLGKCAAGTLYKIAKVLNVTVDSILEANDQQKKTEYRSSFETFKSNTCHHVKDMGDLDFIIDTLENDRIRELYQKGWYPESLYLLGMVDYLSKENGIPICTNYDDLRSCKLSHVIYPLSILTQAAVMGDDNIMAEARRKAIPEFIRFNIVESEVRNIV